MSDSSDMCETWLKRTTKDSQVVLDGVVVPKLFFTLVAEQSA